MPTVRTVRRGELEELLELYGMLQPADPELERTRDLGALWAEMLADDSLSILVVDHDGRLVATCVLSVTKNLTRNARPFAVLENVVTHEVYRGRGYGKRVVQAAIDRAAERGCYKVMLLSGAERDWKLEFYEECGFDRHDKTGFVRYLAPVPGA